MGWSKAGVAVGMVGRWRRLALVVALCGALCGPAARAGPYDAAPAACSCGRGTEGDDEEHWERFRQATLEVFTTEFPTRMMQASDPVHHWITSVHCPELQPGAVRGAAALSDCAPGVVLLHVACSQRLLLQLRFREAQDHMVEALMVLPFAQACLDESVESFAERRWPIAALDMRTNYVRLYRGLSYYEESPELVPELAWRPARNCIRDGDCGPGMVCAGFRCIESDSSCEAGAHECPEGVRCSALRMPSGSDCVWSMDPMCIVNGELEAYHPRSECLSYTVPRMLKACSEMGTTLYQVNWSSVPYEERLREAAQAAEPGGGTFRNALIVPVTMHLASPWHMLHSLIPAYSMMAQDGLYGLMDDQASTELIIVDQDLDKDRHIWDKVLGKQKEGELGALTVLLQVISSAPYRLIKTIERPRCYEHAIWGHELMLYSGGGWTNHTHVHAFAAASKAWVGARPARRGDPSSRHLLLIERRNSSAWGRWIDNFPQAHEAARRWAQRHPHLLGEVFVTDLAELRVTEQLRLVSSMRIVFGAHGDGLSWSAFMEEGGVLLEAVPQRQAGFQVCVEGVDMNPWGIFGGVARLARHAHICFLNPPSGVLSNAMTKEDHFQWGWRQMNLHISIPKLEEYLGVAAGLVQDADLTFG